MQPYAEFLRLLYEGCAGWFPIVLGLPQGGAFPQDVMWFETWQLADPEFKLPIELDAEYHVYCTPHTYTQQGDLNSNASSTGRAVWLESDDEHFNWHAVAEASPSIIVETSPDRHHVYWLLDDDEHLDEIESINRALAYKYLDRDRSGWDLYQLLRVPGFANHKRGYPFEVQVVELRGDRRHSLDSSFNELAIPEANETMGARSREQELSDPPLHIPDKDATLERIGEKLSRTFRRYLNSRNVERSTAMWFMYSECHRLGLTALECYSLIKDSPNNKFRDNHYHGNRELWADLRGVYRILTNNEPVHVKQEIEQARIAPGLSAEARRREISSLVRTHMARIGGLYYVPNRKIVIYQQYQHGRRRLFYVNNKDTDFGAFLERNYGINQASPEFNYVVNHVSNWVIEGGQRVELHNTSYYDQDNNILYISNNNGGMFRLTGEADWEELEIGVDNIMFQEDIFGDAILPQAPPPSDATQSHFDEYVLSWPNYAETQQLNKAEAMRLIKGWTYAMFFLKRAKGLLITTGFPGSGKSTVFKCLEWALRGNEADVVKMPNTPTEVGESIREQHHIFFDGVEEASGWIQNTLSVAATGTRDPKRLHYKDNEFAYYNMSAAIGISTMNADFIRKDIVDRSIVINVDRFEEFKDIEEIAAMVRSNRSYIWHEILRDLNAMVHLMKTHQGRTSKLRMANITKIIEVMCEVKGYNAARLINYLAREQANRTIEDDPVWECLQVWLGELDLQTGAYVNLCRSVDISKLHQRLAAIAKENHFNYAQEVKSAKQLTWKLKALTPSLPNLELVQGKEGRISTFTFNPKLTEVTPDEESTFAFTT